MKFIKILYFSLSFNINNATKFILIIISIADGVRKIIIKWRDMCSKNNSEFIQDNSMSI